MHWKTFFVSLIVSAIAVDASAQYSKDAWTAYMEQRGLFTAHLNDCSASEAFVATGPGNLGICMEVNERTGAEFEDARKTCFDLGKRLPEPVEFKYACLNTGGLNNMTNNPEWGSNYTTLTKDDNTSNGFFISSVNVGNGSCYYSDFAEVSAWNGASGGHNAFNYRCVR